jgi:hypothetical protein
MVLYKRLRFFLGHHIWISSEAPFFRVKETGSKADHLPPFTTKGKERMELKLHLSIRLHGMVHYKLSTWTTFNLHYRNVTIKILHHFKKLFKRKYFQKT